MHIAKEVFVVFYNLLVDWERVRHEGLVLCAVCEDYGVVLAELFDRDSDGGVDGH